MASALNSVIDNIVSKVFDNTLIPVAELAVNATYKNVTTGSYDPSTSTISRTETDISLKVIKRNESALPIGGITSEGSATKASNSNQISGFLEFLVRPIEGVLPSQGIDDELTVDGVTYKVMDIKSINMGSDRLIYKIKAVG